MNLSSRTCSHSIAYFELTKFFPGCRIFPSKCGSDVASPTFSSFNNSPVTLPPSSHKATGKLIKLTEREAASPAMPLGWRAGAAQNGYTATYIVMCARLLSLSRRAPCFLPGWCVRVPPHSLRKVGRRRQPGSRQS